jgi:hypothetical protein
VKDVYSAFARLAGLILRARYSDMLGANRFGGNWQSKHILSERVYLRTRRIQTM